MQSDQSSSKGGDKNASGTPAAASAKSVKAGPGGNGGQKNAADKPPKEGGRSAWILAFLAFIIAVIGLVLDFTLWQWGDVEFDEFDARIDTVERGLEKSVQELMLPKVSQLKSEQGVIQKSISSLESDVGRISDSLDQTQLQTSDLTDKVEGGRTRWKLLEIEGLLLAANERLQLHRDIEGSVEALSVASLRLARLNDPRLFKLRSQVTEEISTLESLPRPDIEGLAFKLSSLMQQMPEWPLASTVPERYTPDQPVEESGFNISTASWENFKNTVAETLGNLFTVRQSEGSYEPIMPPQQEFFLRQNLLLKLQTARLALLQRNTTAWRSTLDETGDWLKTFFASDTAAVGNAMEQLERMQREELAWREPDISGSLTGLREYLRQLGRGETLPAAESLTTPPAPSSTGEDAVAPKREQKRKQEPEPVQGQKKEQSKKKAPVQDESAAADAAPESSSPPADEEQSASTDAETADDADSNADEPSVKAPAARLDDGLSMQNEEQAEGAE